MKEEHQKACGHGADGGNMFQGIKDANYHSPWRNKVNRLTLRNREVRIIHKTLETLLSFGDPSIQQNGSCKFPLSQAWDVLVVEKQECSATGANMKQQFGKPRGRIHCKGWQPRWGVWIHTPFMEWAMNGGWCQGAEGIEASGHCNVFQSKDGL